MTVGIFSGSQTVQGSITGEDTSGKDAFSITVDDDERENRYIYRQYAQLLLGHASGSFYAPGINKHTMEVLLTRTVTLETGP